MPFTYLNQVSEDVLARIIDYTGIPWLHELLKVGNRLLSSKILQSRAITCYSNLDYYGNPSSWSESVIIRLQGLKSLILKNPYYPAIWDAPSSSLLLNLPKSVTEIELEALNSLTRCSTSAIGSSNVVPFDFRIFPNLNSLALRCPQEKAVEVSNPENLAYDLNKICPLEIPLPPSLTKFELNWPLKNIMSQVMRLPKTLRILGFMIGEMNGISWIHEFPNLEELTIDSTNAIDFNAQERDLKVIKPHPTLKLFCFEYLDLTDPQQVPALFAHLVNVESLSVPRLEFHHSLLTMFKNLRFLKCTSSDDRESPSEDILGRDWYSPKLVELHCVNPLISSMMVKLQQLPLLSILHILGLTEFEILRQLPKSLTRLTLASTSATLHQIGATLPALVYLRVRVGGFGGTFQPSDLACLGPSAVVCQVDIETHVRVQDASLSLDGECGWTNLPHAASKYDFDSMERILQVQVAKTSAWLRRFVEEYDNVPFEIFDWLRLRGVLSKPQRVGSLLFSPLFKIALELKATSLVTWALDLLSDRDSDGWSFRGPSRRVS